MLIGPVIRTVENLVLAIYFATKAALLRGIHRALRSNEAYAIRNELWPKVQAVPIFKTYMD